MAEPDQQKTLTLAEQWSLQDSGDKSDQNESTGNIKPTLVAEENGEIPDQEVALVKEKVEEIPVIDEITLVAEENGEIPDQEVIVVEEKVEHKPEKSDEVPAADEISIILVAEENGETPEQEATLVEEEAEEKLEIKLETAPADFRFPTTNQTRHCFTRYIEYHRCVAAKGEDAPECEKFAKYYRSLCPSEWVERWSELRENGTFSGPL